MRSRWGTGNVRRRRLPGTRGVAFDHVIVGSGVSGVLLAREILHAADNGGLPKDQRVLLADPEPGRGRRETLAHWAAGPTTVDRWALGRWDQLTVIGHDQRPQRIHLGSWRYTAINWQGARADLLAELTADPRVTLLAHAVDQVCDGDHSAAVLVDGEWIGGSWVYDSRPAPCPPPDPRRGRSARLVQSFKGVWVQTTEPVVDCSAATLLDFASDDGPDLGFASVLPVSPHSAMVMAVRMGATTNVPDPIPAVPHALGEHRWRIVAEEGGVTPLVSAPRRRAGHRILDIGVRGGRVRPSTGYALTRILADSRAIAGSLRRHGHPFAIPADPDRDRILDAIWLQALAEQRAALEPAFLALFSHAPITSVLSFLDGRASPLDTARIVAALPRKPFLKAATHVAIGHRP